MTDDFTDDLTDDFAEDFIDDRIEDLTEDFAEDFTDDVTDVFVEDRTNDFADDEALVLWMTEFAFIADVTDAGAAKAMQETSSAKAQAAEKLSSVEDVRTP